MKHCDIETKQWSPKNNPAKVFKISDVLNAPMKAMGKSTDEREVGKEQGK